MAYTKLQSTSKGASTSVSVTTDAADFTGCDLLVVLVAWFGATTPDGVLTDSTGVNTYSSMTKQTSPDKISLQAFYVRNPTVSGSMTFTYSGVAVYPSVVVYGFSGSASSPLHNQNGTSAVSVFDHTLAPGSISTFNTELVVTALSFDNDTSASLSGSFSTPIIVPVNFSTESHYGCAAAYKIESADGSENPTWSTAAGRDLSATIGSFTAAVAGSSRPVKMAGEWGGFAGMGGGFAG